MFDQSSPANSAAPPGPGEQRRMRRERLEALVAPAAQLAIVEPTLTGVLMMDAAEARECLSAIRSDLAQAETAERSARQRLLDWKEREGWRALGYASFVVGVQAEIGPWGKAHIYRLLGAAQIERILGLDQSPMGDSEVPERQLRELLPLLSDPRRCAPPSCALATHRLKRPSMC